MKINPILKDDIIKYLQELIEIEEKRGDRVQKKNFDKATRHYFKVGYIKATIAELNKM